MIKREDILSIEKLLNNKKIVNCKLLSNSFGINCIKFLTNDKKNYIAKYYIEQNSDFNAIKSETQNLMFLNDLNLNFFPSIFSNDNKFIIISYFDNNELQPNETRKDLLHAITTLHSIKSDNYGFNFETQIGGLKQKNNMSDNWVNFYREYRLGYIFDLINTKNIMDKSINNKIEMLLKNLENYIPKRPNASLLHGDLWAGNILFNDCKFVGFIDPGSFYGHSELEIAYLRWFNHAFIDKNFLSKYNNIINIGEEYLNYEPIYQLYYSLLNVHLWDREYIKDVRRLLDKIQI